MNTSFIYEPYQSFLQSVPPFSDTMTQDALFDLLGRLGNPQNRLQVIHIAGTNGKGSSVAVLNQLLQTTGYNVATFTSPYINDIRECIHYNSAMITTDFMNHVTSQVKAAYIQMKQDGLSLPTHYECITATAYLAMALWQVDYCIVEVLMGGKDDATNVFSSVIASLITSISYDHTQYLGNTLEDIALHKAGIIKSNCPVFLNKNPENVLDVCIKTASSLNAPLYYSHEYLTTSTPWSASDLHRFKNVFSLSGAHQGDNLEGALAVYHYLLANDDKALDNEYLASTLATINLPCRMEHIVDSWGYHYLIDGGHNAAGLEALYNELTTHYNDLPIHLIFSTLRDKDNTPIMNHLIDLAECVFFCPVENPRSITTDALLERTATSRRKKCLTYPSLDLAFEAEKTTHQQSPHGLTVVCGSFYLAYPIRALVND